MSENAVLITTHDEAVLAKERYELWDDLINDVWGVIKEQLPESEFEQLRQAQIEWIKMKEARFDELSDPNNGSLALANAFYEIKDLTTERTYFLINNYLD